MAEPLELVVQRLLRDSEEVKVAINANAIQARNNSLDAFNTDENLPEDTAVSSDDGGARIVAVVTHLESSAGEEQGCVFILRPRATRSSSATDVYLVDHVFPILDGFTISMAQSRRNTLNLTAVQALNQPRTDFTLTIHPGHDPLLEPVNMVTHDTQRLRTLLTECRRLKEIAISNYEPGTYPPYPWIMPYVTKSQPAVLSTIPPDLRHAHRPTSALLSEAHAGFPGDDIHDISIIREEWIRSKVKEVYDSSEHFTTLRLRVGTFNVNGKLPSQDLSGWVRRSTKATKYIPSLLELSPLSLGSIAEHSLSDVDVSTLNISDRKSEILKTTAVSRSISSSSATTLLSSGGDAEDDDSDLIAVAFQELDLSAGALLYSTETTREDAWYTAVMAGLGEKAHMYTKLASKQLVGMLLIIIVKSAIKDRFTHVQATSIGAGILGLMGNKGATALRLTYRPPSSSDVPSPRPTVLTFVNSHLAAFDEMYEKRNEDFHDISKRLVFDSGIPAHDFNHSKDYNSSPSVPLNIYQSDSLFWMGDLNYRINLPDSDIRTLLSEDTQDNIPILLQYDQCTLAARTDKAFAHFVEHPITHMPSYRFGSGVSCDRQGYDLKRKPAWTDRVLHMSSPVAIVTQSTYTSHPEIAMSDHKPVSAEFQIHMPTIDSDELNGLIHSLWRDVTNFEDSEEVPRLQLGAQGLDFGDVRYKQARSRTLRVANVGKLPSTFRFVPLAPGIAAQPDWLRIEPQTGLLRAGEQTDITFSVGVDDASAKHLNLLDGRLEVTLILHTALGKDHFLTVTGQYERTCFATSLARLVRMPGPVRTLINQELLPEEEAVNAPKEIMRLVNWLMTEATSLDTLFLSPGDPEWIIQIRESLDIGTDFPTPAAEKRDSFCLSVAQCLLQFLDSLPEPVVPIEVHPACMEVSSRDEAFELLNEFPSASVNVWISVTSFLHFISQGASSRKAERLAAVFAPVLLRDTASITPISPIRKRRFILYFIL